MPLARTLALLCCVSLSGGASHDAPPEIYRFRLTPTGHAPGASGAGQLHLAWSPFGIAVTEDGYHVYDLEVTLDGLLDPGRYGAFTTYVAWIASPSLDRVERLGAVVENRRVAARVASWNKFLILVTPEPIPEAVSRSGPVMLRGRSPSGLIASFQSHELFNLIPH